VGIAVIVSNGGALPKRLAMRAIFDLSNPTIWLKPFRNI